MCLRGGNGGRGGAFREPAPITRSAPSPASLGRKGNEASNVRRAVLQSWPRKSKWC